MLPAPSFRSAFTNQRDYSVLRLGAVCLLLPTLPAGCAGNPASFKQKGEVVTAKVKLKVKEDAGGTYALAAKSVPALLAPIAISAAISFGKSQLEKEAARYTANHSANAATDFFYSKGPVFNIDSLGYKRRVWDGSATATAMSFILKAEPSRDRRFFRLRLQDLKVALAKAKLRASDATLDLLIEVKMQGFWIDKEQKIHAETIGQTSFPVYGYTLAKSGNAATVRFAAKGSLIAPCSDWLPMVPLSQDPAATAAADGGPASFTITVSEVDDYGKRIQKVAGFINDNAPGRDDLKKLFNKE